MSASRTLTDVSQKKRSTGGPSVSRTLRDKSYVGDTTLRLQAFGFRVVDCKV